MLTPKLWLAALLSIATVLSTGCNTQPNHPNQINTFDGASYDSLTLAHAALGTLRSSISTINPTYRSAFNQADTSYALAYEAYAFFRSASAGQPAAALAISNLAVSVVSLENAIQADLHVAPQTVHSVRARAIRLRASAAPAITISDILTELEIAATIAAAVPGTQPYSTLAEIVIRTTQQALAALSANSGQPIDLSTIQPIAPLP